MDDEPPEVVSRLCSERAEHELGGAGLRSGP
jgi:hypothetical protein